MLVKNGYTGAHRKCYRGTILHRSTPVQLLELIIEPLRSSTPSWQSIPFLLVVDGLDECEGKEAQITDSVSHESINDKVPSSYPFSGCEPPHQTLL